MAKHEAMAGLMGSGDGDGGGGGPEDKGWMIGTGRWKGQGWVPQAGDHNVDSTICHHVILHSVAGPPASVARTCALASRTGPRPRSLLTCILDQPKKKLCPCVNLVLVELSTCPHVHEPAPAFPNTVRHTQS